MKHWLEEYKQAVRQWDKTHRLVGQESIDALVKQSTEALKAFMKSSPPKCLVDVGAGSGLLGMAWLALSEDHKAVFIEPRAKAHSFILYISSALPPLKGRFLLLPQKLEDVSRETVSRFAPEGFVLTSRAFSGPASLEEAIENSPFSQDPFYVFSSDIADSKKAQYVLKKLQ